jgi:hypothetical protein
VRNQASNILYDPNSMVRVLSAAGMNQNDIQEIQRGAIPDFFTAAYNRNPRLTEEQQLDIILGRMGARQLLFGSRVRGSSYISEAEVDRATRWGRALASKSMKDKKFSKKVKSALEGLNRDYKRNIDPIEAHLHPSPKNMDLRTRIGSYLGRTKIKIPFILAGVPVSLSSMLAVGSLAIGTALLVPGALGAGAAASIFGGALAPILAPIIATVLIVKGASMLYENRYGKAATRHLLTGNWTNNTSKGLLENAKAFYPEQQITQQAAQQFTQPVSSQQPIYQPQLTQGTQFVLQTQPIQPVYVNQQRSSYYPQIVYANQPQPGQQIVYYPQTQGSQQLVNYTMQSSLQQPNYHSVQSGYPPSTYESAIGQAPVLYSIQSSSNQYQQPLFYNTQQSQNQVLQQQTFPDLQQSAPPSNYYQQPQQTVFSYSPLKQSQILRQPPICNNQQQPNHITQEIKEEGIGIAVNAFRQSGAVTENRNANVNSRKRSMSLS